MGTSKDAAVVYKKVVSVDSKESRECFYCHEVGHLIANCPTLKRKAGRKEKFSKSVALIERSVLSLEQNESVSSSSESIFEPFIYDGFVSLTKASSEMKRIRILRDTGAAQSFILQGALPFSEQSSCVSSVLVQGIDLTVIKAPLHQVFLRAGIISGNVKLALRAQLPVKDVSLILGNDLAGDKVFCLPEVTETPVATDVDVLCEEFPDVFGTCVVTRSQACKFRDTVDLSDAPIMIFRGRFRYRFFSSKLADSDSDTDFFPLSNQQEIMKDSNTNKVVI